MPVSNPPFRKLEEAVGLTIKAATSTLVGECAVVFSDGSGVCIGGYNGEIEQCGIKIGEWHDANVSIATAVELGLLFSYQAEELKATERAAKEARAVEYRAQELERARKLLRDAGELPA